MKTPKPAVKALHPKTEARLNRIFSVRALGTALARSTVAMIATQIKIVAQVVATHTPAGDEQNRSIRYLREALFWARAAIENAPEDEAAAPTPAPE